MAQAHFEDTKIRRAGRADAADIRELTRSAYAKWVPLIGREPTPMGADYDRAVREHMIDLLLVGARLVALIETVNKADHLLIANVAVAPPFQGRGYGRYLLDHAERLATSLGLPELRLYTHKRFVTNIELYRRFGYSIDREEPFMGGFLVHMSKRPRHIPRSDLHDLPRGACADRVMPADAYSGTTAVVSISTLARSSISALTSTTAIAG